MMSHMLKRLTGGFTSAHILNHMGAQHEVTRPLSRVVCGAQGASGSAAGQYNDNHNIWYITCMIYMCDRCLAELQAVPLSELAVVGREACGDGGMAARLSLRSSSFGVWPRMVALTPRRLPSCISYPS